jgi:hypothetical protein
MLSFIEEVLLAVLFGYKFKLMNRNFIQGHPFHLELSPYLLLVSLALLITTLSGVITFYGYSNEGIFLLLPGFLSIILAMELWFQVIVQRATDTIASVRKWLLLLYLCSFLYVFS